MNKLDDQIAIADAFDSGQLGRQATTTEIAAAAGISLTRLTRLYLSLEFRVAKHKRPVRDRVPHRYAPPRQFARLSGRVSPVAKAIAALYENGQWSGRCYANELEPLIDGASEEQVRRALRRLKFRVVKRSHLKKVGVEPAVWERPREWPAILLKQRTLRRSGLSAARVVAATDAAAAVPDIIRDAVQQLDMSDIPLDRRGALKSKIKEVIAGIYHEWKEESISKRQLAGWLKESPNTPLNALIARNEQMIRFVMNKVCSNCGHRVK